MKKILSLILACVLCFTTMSITAFAGTTDKGLFGVITDAEGNVVEVLAMPRTSYVNSVYTIPAKGSLTTYQYEVRDNFYFGYATTDTDGNKITESNRNLILTVEGSATIGASNRTTLSNLNVTTGVGDKNGIIGLTYTNGSYTYYNGKITNQSSLPVTVRVIVLVNYDQDELSSLL